RRARLAALATRGGGRGLPALPAVRHLEAVPGTRGRAPAGRAGSHGGRPRRRGLRESRRAGAVGPVGERRVTARDGVWVVTIGDELLRGEIVDSNKSPLSQRMLALELETARHVSVPDDPAMMEEVLREAAARARVVLVSGGLGPTRDDLTT